MACAVVTAPISEPIPAAADSNPNSRGPALNDTSASNGISTCQLKTNVNMIARTISGRRSSSVRHTYFSPATRRPRSRVDRGCRWNSDGCIAISAPSTNRYDTASRPKHQAMPAPAITRPAIAGPITRAPVKAALLRLTAFVNESSPTIST